MRAVLIAALLAGTALGQDAACLLPIVTAPVGTPINALAWYRFDGDATDATGNGYDGTVYGATATNDSGRSAYYFNGTSNYVEVAHNAALAGFGDFAIAFWVKSTQGATAAHLALASKYLATGNRRGWAITSAPTTGNLTLLWSTLGSNVSATTLDKRANVFDGAWHHIAISRSGSALSYYRDGEFVASFTVSGTGYATTVKMIIAGMDGSPIGMFCQGTLDDLRIFNVRLSAPNVARIATGQDVAPIEELQ